MRLSLFKTLCTLKEAARPLTPKECSEISGVSNSVTAAALVELFDNLHADREHLGGRRGFAYTLLPLGSQLLVVAMQEMGMRPARKIKTKEGK